MVNSKIKILVLEDDPERHKHFRDELALQHDLTIVDNAAECIDLLNTYNYNCLFLDHDLGGRAFVDSEEPNTGYQVAIWLEANPTRKPKNIIIHSLNGAGAANMLRALPDAKYVPFAWLYLNGRIQIHAT